MYFTGGFNFPCSTQRRTGYPVFRAEASPKRKTNIPLGVTNSLIDVFVNEIAAVFVSTLINENDIVVKMYGNDVLIKV